jgi:RNA polymerase sigma factor (sigma-70 family)
MSRALRGLLQRITTPLGGQTTDGELLQRFCAGRDEAAFAELVQRYGAMVFSVCRRLLCDHHDAEDAFQATFLALARKAGSLDGTRPLGCWLHTVACNMSLKLKAAARRRPVVEQASMDTTVNLREEALEHDFREVLDAELARLPEKYRAPLILCYLDGKTHEAAARDLGWPVGSIARRLARGRELLRGRLSARLALYGTLPAALLAEPVRAAVPAALAASTSAAAVAFAATDAVAAGIASARALTLAREAVRAMALARLKVVLACVVVVGVTAGGVAGWRSVTADAAAPAAPAAAAQEVPQAPAEDPKIQALRDRLSQHVTCEGFDPNTPLEEALASLEKDYTLKIGYDRALGDRLPKLKKEPIRLPKMVNTPLYRILDHLLAQAEVDGQRVRYRIRPDALEITTARGDAVVRGARVPLEARNELATRMIQEIREKLDSSITLAGFEPNTPAKEAIGFLSERYGMNIFFREGEFKRVGFKEPCNAPVELAQETDVPLGVLLRQLLVQLAEPDHTAVRFRLRTCDVEIVPDLHAGLVFSPDGKRLATVSADGRTGQLVRVWDRASGGEREKRTAEVDVAGIAFAPDASKLVALWCDDIASARSTLASWKTLSAKGELRKLSATGRLALAPDGQRAAWAAAGKWHVHNTQTGTERAVPVALPSPVIALQFSGDGQTIVGIDHARGPTTAAVWKPGTTESLMRFRLDSKRGGDGMPIADIAVSHDGRLLAALDLVGRASVWELTTCRRICAFESPAIVQSVAISPDGSLIAGITELGAPQTVEVWRILDRQPLCRLRGHPDDHLLSVAFSPDGKTLAACADDGTPVTWDISDLRGVPAAAELPADRLEKLWNQLAADDARHGYRAVLSLSANPRQAVPFLGERLRARKYAEGKLEDALRDLDDDEFARRNQAEKGLLEMGKGIAPRLRQELDKPLPSLELRRRIERILERLDEPTAAPEQLRDLRAVNALERAGTPEALKLLEELARGPAERLLTKAAGEARQRLSRGNAR